MMRKILPALAVAAILSSISSAASYDIAGLWNILGTGFVEKTFLRVSLELTGDTTLTTSTTQEVLDNNISADLLRQAYPESPDILSGDLNFLTAYDINLKISATAADISAWRDHIPNGIKIPVPLPRLAPTKELPYEIPIHVESEGLTYRMTLTGADSGKIRITGIVDFDEVSGVEINSDCTFWKNGTKRPDLEEETNSGCNSGTGMLMLMITMIFAGGLKSVRH